MSCSERKISDGDPMDDNLRPMATDHINWLTTEDKEVFVFSSTKSNFLFVRCKT